MKKLLVISLVSLMLSGCMYQAVNSYDIMRASVVCNGVDDIVTGKQIGRAHV